MEYPLILGGETRGRVSVSREGLYTVVSATAESTGELTRLWLCGEGESFYLGVMREENGALIFSKRYTRRECAAFPKNIAFASDRKSEAKAKKQREAPPQPTQSVGGDIVWHTGRNGVLTASDGNARLLALPSDIGRSIPGADIRVIEGREYMVFRC